MGYGELVMFSRGLFNRLPFNAGNLVIDTLARLKVLATTKSRIKVRL
jgi:hypothetical protein